MRKNYELKTHCSNGHDMSVTRRLLVGKTKKSYCIECQKINTVRYRNDPKNRDRVLKWAAISNRRLRYGIEPDQFRYMLHEQEERCAVCVELLPSDEYEICIDHDHATGRVRGLLCRACNLGIGHFKDNAYRLNAASKYLEAHCVL